MAMLICRLCASSISSHHYLSIFSYSSVQKNWPSRIQQLLSVELSGTENLPHHICNVCKKRVEYLEKAHSDLLLFKSQVKNAEILLSKRPMKRTKETSGSIGVSPDTVRLRPLPKKPLTGRQLNFENGKLYA